MTGWDFLKRMGLAVLGGGVGAAAVGVATMLAMSSGDLEQDLLVSAFQGATVFTALTLLFAIWGRPDRPGWIVPAAGCAFLLGALFWVCTPLLVAQGEGLAEVCVQVLEDADMMFPITTELAKELGWLLIILFPVLIVTAILDLLIMAVMAPFILLASPRVWAAGSGLIALEGAMVLVGSGCSFGVMHLLRQQLFPPATEP